MNISQWPIGKIMQLPDYCFGRRWLVSCSLAVLGGETSWDISEIAFPEVIVIWYFFEYTQIEAGLDVYFRVALGDRLPTTVAEMDGLEPLFAGWGLQGAGPRDIPFPSSTNQRIHMLRQNVHTGGRRLVLEADAPPINPVPISIGVVVSGIPKEVPDWMISA